jgi:hypothetical protein
MMMMRQNLGAVDYAWCTDTSSVWSYIRGVVDPRCLPIHLTDAAARIEYGSDMRTPLPAPVAPTVSIDPVTGVVTPETPQEHAARVAAQYRDFFGGISDNATAAQCSHAWSVLDSDCNKAAALYWGALTVGGFLLLRGLLRR